MKAALILCLGFFPATASAGLAALVRAELPAPEAAPEAEPREEQGNKDETMFEIRREQVAEARRHLGAVADRARSYLILDRSNPERMNRANAWWVLSDRVAAHLNKSKPLGEAALAELVKELRESIDEYSAYVELDKKLAGQAKADRVKQAEELFELLRDLLA